MKSVDISNINELQKISKYLALKLTSPQIILFQGPLGVGKTQMICFMAEALGIDRKDISSPAFSLINVYRNLKEDKVYHLDLFRLKSLNDLESTGFWDIFQSPSIVFIEWGNILKEDSLPVRWKKLFIELSFTGTSSRNLNYRFA